MKLATFIFILLFPLFFLNGQQQLITVICTNDLHGALEPLELDWAEGNLVGGISYLAGYANAMKAENPDGWLFLDSGDVFQGTFISYAFQGRSVIDCYNAMDYNAITVGNHEFDWGVDVLLERIAQSNCPFLAANIVNKKSGQLVSWAKPYAIFTRKGIKIGVIGLASEDTYVTTNPINVTEFDFTSAVAAANQYADSVEALGATMIILLAHIGGTQDDYGEVGALATALDPERFDLIVAGHIHKRLDDVINGIPVLENYANSTAIGRIDFYVDPVSGEVESFFMNENPRTTYHTYEGKPATYHDRVVVPDAKVDQIYQFYKQQLDTIQNRVVGHAAVRIGKVDGPEWPIGNLIADAVRACTDVPANVPHIDFAMTNNGGIRTDFPQGPITYGRVFQVFPFDNFLVILPITGRQFKDIIEDMLSDVTEPNQISGFSFVYDPAKSDGNRVNPEDIMDWQTNAPVQADKTYYLAVSDYMYNVNPLLQERQRIDTRYLYRELILDYLTENSPVTAKVEGRITIRTDVKEHSFALTHFQLEQNYPNPFNSSTVFRYFLPVPCKVELELYNIRGQKLSTLISENQESGFHTCEWDAGTRGSGVYLVRLVADELAQTKKLILVK